MAKTRHDNIGAFFPRLGPNAFGPNVPDDQARLGNRVWKGSPARLLVPAGQLVPLFGNKSLLLTQLFLEADADNQVAIVIGNRNVRVTPAVPGYSTSTVVTLDPEEAAMVYTDDALREFFDAGTWYARHPAPVAQFLNMTYWNYTEL